MQNIIASQSSEHTTECVFLRYVCFVYIFIKCPNGNINGVTTAIAAMMTPTMNIPYHTYAIDSISKKCNIKAATMKTILRLLTILILWYI